MRDNIKTIGKGGFSLVYLVRNYRNSKLKNKNNLARLSTNKVFDYEGDLT